MPALIPILRRVQHELFNLGSILATQPEDVHPKQARVTEAEVRQLEIEIDRMNADLAPLRSFVLPGGTRLNTELHACRTICRRAERLAVTLGREEPIPPETIQYLNRLSDAFFVWSRWVNHVLGVPEVLWEPNQSASGRHCVAHRGAGRLVTAKRPRRACVVGGLISGIRSRGDHMLLAYAATARRRSHNASRSLPHK